MTGKASRRKGHAYERQIASDFRDWGFEAQTARSLRHGLQLPEDVVVKDYAIYVETKAVKTGRLHEWIKKATQEAGKRPVAIFWKRPHKGEVVIMPKADFEKLWREGCDPWWTGGGE